ncbi:MAG: hypothetical protein WCO57_07435, partial [Verrucomicrobiota bacterium]
MLAHHSGAAQQRAVCCENIWAWVSWLDHKLRNKKWLVGNLGNPESIWWMDEALISLIILKIIRGFITEFRISDLICVISGSSSHYHQVHPFLSIHPWLRLRFLGADPVVENLVRVAVDEGF